MMSVAGSYGITINSPLGVREGILTLEVAGSNLSGALLSDSVSEEFSGGTVYGSNISWEMNLTHPMPLHLVCSANISGDAIDGTIQLGAFGEAIFSGDRI